MTRYFLGVDAGGTKSHAIVADDTGQALGFGHGTAGNHESIGLDGLYSVMKSTIDAALSSAGIKRGQLAGAGFGLGGYDWPGDDKPIRKVINALRLRAPYDVVNDATIALLAGASQGWGVAIIGGTGCNARGRDRHGREGRVTGEGGIMGEHGGAGELVGQALRAVAMAWTRRGPETALTGILIEQAGATDVVDLLEGLCRHRYRLRAALAPLVFRAAYDGDAVAADCIRWAGCELGSLANGVIRQLELEAETFEVVLAGSLFKGGALLIDAVAETVHDVAPQAKLVRLHAPPVVGGVILGMEQAGLRDAAVSARLMESIPALVEES